MEGEDEGEWGKGRLVCGKVCGNVEKLDEGVEKYVDKFGYYKRKCSA